VRDSNYCREIFPGPGDIQTLESSTIRDPSPALFSNRTMWSAHSRDYCSRVFSTSKVSGLGWIKMVQRTSISLIYGQYLLFALGLRIVCTQSILGLSIIYRKILQRFFPFPFNRPSDLVTPWCDSAFEGIWSHVKSITTPPSIFTSISGRGHLRIVKDVNWNLLPRFI
jgi:hypothetical protein